MAETKQYLDYEGLVRFVELIQANFPTKEMTATALDAVNQCLTELIEKYNEHTHSLENSKLNVSYANGKLTINSSHNHTVQTISDNHLQTPPPALPEGLRPNGGGGSTIDYSKEYFTIEALEDGLTAKLSINASEYRVDNGEWISLTANTATPSINSGQKIAFKITNPTIVETYGIGTFTVNKAFNVEGNIMSLHYGDNFEGQIDLSGKRYAFYKLFRKCATLQNAENLILPATTLARYCYSSMFPDCTSLTSAPELPATTLENADYCYNSMFNGCTSLVEAPQLPATMLASYCYQNMFRDCTSLTSAPQLPATILKSSCYVNMFYGCTSLVEAPQLPATALSLKCYSNMFYNCSKLNKITMLATNISSSDGGLSNWVVGVASSGTFVKAASMTSLPTGVSGIPSGWTVQNYQG